ncbi:MAG: signal peptide peptidase SppA [Bacteroidales bacterium]|nr:signal peptide peptidase SppA [Bacteroidales bacterium]
MKEFFKMVLAVVCGLFIAGIIALILGMGFVSSLAAAGSASTALPKSGVMVMDMSKIVISEQSTPASPDVMSLVSGGGSMVQNIGLWKAVQAINKAAEDPAVKYIYIKADGASGGMAQLQELRKSLANFRMSGKPVISYIEGPSTASYYLASVSDKIYMTSYQGANSSLTGIGGRLTFYKDLLDKLGVNVQLIRHGKYKSAGEGYIKNSPSPENLEQNRAMIDAIWGSYASEIAESRRMSVEAVNAAIDGLKLNLPEDYLREGFVDELLDREGLENKLADLAVVESFKKLKSFTLADYISAKVVPNTKVKQKIAILYADGEIIDGEGKQDVAGDYFARVISKVRADSTIKAVVFRVNSPGGSVLASEKIKAGIELLMKEKPVVASYGNYAASGGYWISNNCDKIYSDATTLTGSIGVFSMIPDLSKTVRDLAHVNIVTVGSSKHADMYSLMRPLDQEELDYMQASVENIYTRFVNTVSEGRGLEPDFVDSIAQGRVWAGSDAIKIGLVDEIGTLEDAVKWAASAGGDADLTAWNVVEYPKPLSEMERMMEMFGQGVPPENIFSGTPFGDAAGMLLDWYERVKKNPADVMFARIPYVIDIR